MFGDFTKAISPVHQDFIWMAEYPDGYLAEYDFQSRIESQLDQIDRMKLVRFGLVGCGMRLYYEVSNGIFKLDGRMIEVIFQTSDRDYYLTGQITAIYNDIIQHKDAESVRSIKKKKDSPFIIVRNSGLDRIRQYNFGYKTLMTIGDTSFYFKAICQIPYNEPVRIHFELRADKKLEGELLIKRNGMIVDQYPVVLSREVGGEIYWLVK